MAVVLKKLREETYPIVKWVGGKRQLMFELQKNMPEYYNRYFEPFIGGGALFFYLQPDNAYISEIPSLSFSANHISSLLNVSLFKFTVSCVEYIN